LKEEQKGNLEQQMMQGLLQVFIAFQGLWPLSWDLLSLTKLGQIEKRKKKRKSQKS